MGRKKQINRRNFIQLSTLASAGVAIGCNYSSSSSSPTSYSAKDIGWDPRPLKKKPKILMVILDDIGFGDLGSYGAEQVTTCVDKLASEGTRFNNFHVTALCTPTRACLPTGRNAHAVGVGNIAEWERDHESYRGCIRQDAATLSEVLESNDYTTHTIGKWHFTLLDGQNTTGPFKQWPIGKVYPFSIPICKAKESNSRPKYSKNTI